MNTEAIKTIIEEFLGRLSVPVTDIEVDSEGDLVVFNIVTSESGLLIGKEGENIRAIGYLLGHIASHKAGHYTKFNIDVNGYRKQEREKVLSEAAHVAGMVRTSKIDTELRPMTPFERMLVHNMFTSDSEIETESVGEGDMRRIVLRAKQ